jgi:hypothetical protein
MEFLRSSRSNRTKFIGVVIRPASKRRLSPLNSLERGGLLAPNGRLPMAPTEEYTPTRITAPARHQRMLENP